MVPKGASPPRLQTREHTSHYYHSEKTRFTITHQHITLIKSSRHIRQPNTHSPPSYIPVFILSCQAVVVAPMKLAFSLSLSLSASVEEMYTHRLLHADFSRLAGPIVYYYHHVAAATGAICDNVACGFRKTRRKKKSLCTNKKRHQQRCGHTSHSTNFCEHSPAPRKRPNQTGRRTGRDTTTSTLYKRLVHMQTQGNTGGAQPASGDVKTELKANHSTARRVRSPMSSLASTPSAPYCDVSRCFRVTH